MNIFDTPEHERRLPSAPDTLRGLEEAVIEVAINWRFPQEQPVTATGHMIRERHLFDLIDALIEARGEK